MQWKKAYAVQSGVEPKIPETAESVGNCNAIGTTPLNSSGSFPDVVGSLSGI